MTKSPAPQQARQRQKLRRSKADKAVPSMARRAALDCLAAAFQQGRHLSEALEEDPHAAALSPRDSAFLRHLLSTCLRHLGEIDLVLEKVLARSLPKKAPWLHNLLRLGTAQILFLKTPPHAAVSTSLSLAETPKGRHYKPMINAVLRRIAREGDELLTGIDPCQVNLPAWLRQRWEGAYGPDATRDIAQALMWEAPLDLTFTEGAKAATEWVPAFQEAGHSVQVLPNGSLRISGQSGDVRRLPGFDQGIWWVQDAAASLPAHLFGDLAGKRIVDLCAAPGGKTAQLAAAGASVVAVDRSAERLTRLKENLARLGLAAEVLARDARKLALSPLAEGILLDAPCSATGTLRRHPDVLYHHRAGDLEKLTALQDDLLECAARNLAPGGFLVFATCSLQPEEGPERIAAFLARRKDFRRRPIAAEEIFGLSELLESNGDLRSFPSHLAALGGLDGFFVCRLERIET
jgi:16S rRNA (cytosine967-C5)-methyltransferase